jgi:hypothetical protein
MEKERRRLYYDADWKAIRAALTERVATTLTVSSLDTTDQLDIEAKALVALVSTTLEEIVQRAKLSPYTKRWWTRELTYLRYQLTALRNRVTTLRRRNQDTTHTRMLVHQARRTYFDEIDRPFGICRVPTLHPAG